MSGKVPQEPPSQYSALSIPFLSRALSATCAMFMSMNVVAWISAANTILACCCLCRAISTLLLLRLIILRLLTFRIRQNIYIKRTRLSTSMLNCIPCIISKSSRTFDRQYQRTLNTYVNTTAQASRQDVVCDRGVLMTNSSMCLGDVTSKHVKARLLARVWPRQLHFSLKGCGNVIELGNGRAKSWLRTSKSIDLMSWRTM